MTPPPSLRAPFTTREVVGLVPGVTYRQVDYWARRGPAFGPSVQSGREGGPHGRLWSRRDVVVLRVAALVYGDDNTAMSARPRRRLLESLVTLLRRPTMEDLADCLVVVVEGEEAVLMAFDEFAGWWRAGPPSGRVKVIPLSPVVEDLLGMGP